MKKNILLVIAVAMVFVMVSCGQDAKVAQSQSIEENLYEDIANYSAAKKAVLNTCLTRTASDTISYEKMLVMSEKLDSISRAFNEAHPKFANRVIKKIQYEDLEIMRVEPDSLLAFVKANYSSGVYNCVYENLKKYGYKSSEKLTIAPSENYNKLESNDDFYIDNVKTSTDLADKVVTWNKNSQTSNSSKNSRCLAQYKEDCKNCNIAYVVDCVVAGLCIAVSTPTTAVGGLCAAYSLVEAYNDYLDCCSDAKRFYNLCLK